MYEQGLLPGALPKGVYLRRQAKLWFAADLALDSQDAAQYQAACVALGEYLHQHTAFQLQQCNTPSAEPQARRWWLVYAVESWTGIVLR